MAIKRLYRVIARQRVNWTPLPLGGVDGTAHGLTPPHEIENPSIERDITDYVSDYKFSSSREAMSSELKLDFLNPDGVLTPDNTRSELNFTVLNGIRTFTPLIVEGTEIQVYRVLSSEYLNVIYMTDPTKWIPRFRGVIKSKSFGTDSGQDSASIMAGDVLYPLSKKTMTATYSPIMRSSSQCPGNTFYTLSTLASARDIFLDQAYPQRISAANGAYTPPALSQPGEISSTLLSRLFYWDRDDVWRQLHTNLTVPYFLDSTFTDESADLPGQAYITATDISASAIWNLNGFAWFVESGTGSVSKDATPTGILNDPEGSLLITQASLRHSVYKPPTGTTSRVTFGYRIADSASTLTVKLVQRQFNRATRTYVSAGSVIATSGAITGVTAFDTATLGGLVLNPPTDVPAVWKRFSMEPLPKIAANTFDQDTPLGIITIHELRIEVIGTVWVDTPRWEFMSVDKNPADSTAIICDNNVIGYPVFERWTTLDGTTYTDPNTVGHRSLSKKNVQVVLRSLSLPYGAGTDFGYGPSHLKNRSLWESGRYQTELVEGQDFEILYDKGAVLLSTAYPQAEVFVKHTFYDLESSQHMEAATMIKMLMVNGGGINPDKITMEPTGIILSKVSLDSTTSPSIFKAIQDIRGQLAANYHIYADGDANVFGAFIQQSGSPRLFNPIKQAPLPQKENGALVINKEYWYTVTALMADGKETLASNLISTVDYADYFDSSHRSSVDGSACPALCIKPVIGQVALVVRRAGAYKQVVDAVISAAPVAKVSWNFNGDGIGIPTAGTIPLVGDLGFFEQVPVAVLNNEQVIP